MNISELHDFFIEAATTERKLPYPIRKQKMSNWPDHLQEWSAYGYSTTRTPVIKATPDEISRWEKAITYTIELSNQEDRKLIWAVAHSAAFRDRGPRWSKIAKILGLNDPRIVKRRYQDALVKLHYKTKAFQ